MVTHMHHKQHFLNSPNKATPHNQSSSITNGGGAVAVEKADYPRPMRVNSQEYKILDAELKKKKRPSLIMGERVDFMNEGSMNRQDDLFPSSPHDDNNGNY